MKRAFIIDVIDIHSKLAVYWDDMGAFRASQAHHWAAVRAVSISGTYLLAKHGHSCLVARCLLDRALTSAMPIYFDAQELKGHRSLQMRSLNAMLSLNASAKRDTDADLEEACYAALSVEAIVTRTPPSMMVGYQGLASDTLLLRNGHKMHVHSCNIALSDYYFLRAREKDVEVSTSPPMRVRVGFLSSFFYDHSVGRLLSTVITALDTLRFEVFVILLDIDRGSISDDVLTKLRHSNCSLIYFPARGPSSSLGRLKRGNAISDVVNTVRSLDLHVLVFGELGMDKRTIAVARFRLCAVQVAFWGHPVSQVT